MDFRKCFIVQPEVEQKKQLLYQQAVKNTGLWYNYLFYSYELESSLMSGMMFLNDLILVRNYTFIKHEKQLSTCI